MLVCGVGFSLGINGELQRFLNKGIQSYVLGSLGRIGWRLVGSIGNKKFIWVLFEYFSRKEMKFKIQILLQLIKKSRLYIEIQKVI